MKKLVLSIAGFFFAIGAYSQELGQVIFSQGTTLSSLSFRTDQDIFIRLSETGSLLEWGIAWQHPGYNPYPGKLQAYMGRVDYYGAEYDSVLRGKVKSIGTCTITYYPASETAARAGKVKSIGRSMVDYYEIYENTAFRGKIKQAGSTNFTFYPAYENEAYRGKLKSVGTNSITYYSSFDDKYIRGKIKSIGSARYEWYTQTDSRGYPGSLKTGSYEQNLSGITFLLLY